MNVKAERRGKAEARHRQILDAMEAEQSEYIKAHIVRLKNSGDRREAETWQHELDHLRETLEATMPLPGGTSQ